jgi:hypothetical protein
MYDQSIIPSALGITAADGVLLLSRYGEVFQPLIIFLKLGDADNER